MIERNESSSEESQPISLRTRSLMSTPLGLHDDSSKDKLFPGHSQHIKSMKYGNFGHLTEKRKESQPYNHWQREEYQVDVEFINQRDKHRMKTK